MGLIKKLTDWINAPSPDYSDLSQSRTISTNSAGVVSVGELCAIKHNRAEYEKTESARMRAGVIRHWRILINEKLRDAAGRGCMFVIVDPSKDYDWYRTHGSRPNMESLGWSAKATLVLESFLVVLEELKQAGYHIIEKNDAGTYPRVWIITFTCAT